MKPLRSGDDMQLQTMEEGNTSSRQSESSGQDYDLALTNSSRYPDMYDRHSPENSLMEQPDIDCNFQVSGDNIVAKPTQSVAKHPVPWVDTRSNWHTFISDHTPQINQSLPKKPSLTHNDLSPATSDTLDPKHQHSCSSMERQQLDGGGGLHSRDIAVMVDPHYLGELRHRINELRNECDHHKSDKDRLLGVMKKPQKDVANKIEMLTLMARDLRLEVRKQNEILRQKDRVIRQKEAEVRRVQKVAEYFQQQAKTSTARYMDLQEKWKIIAGQKFMISTHEIAPQSATASAGILDVGAASPPLAFKAFKVLPQHLNQHVGHPFIESCEDIPAASVSQFGAIYNYNGLDGSYHQDPSQTTSQTPPANAEPFANTPMRRYSGIDQFHSSMANSASRTLPAGVAQIANAPIHHQNGFEPFSHSSRTNTASHAPSTSAFQPLSSVPSHSPPDLFYQQPVASENRPRQVPLPVNEPIDLTADDTPIETNFESRDAAVVNNNVDIQRSAHAQLEPIATADPIIPPDSITISGTIVMPEVGLGNPTNEVEASSQPEQLSSPVPSVESSSSSGSRKRSRNPKWLTTDLRNPSLARALGIAYNPAKRARTDLELLPINAIEGPTLTKKAPARQKASKCSKKPPPPKAPVLQDAPVPRPVTQEEADEFERLLELEEDGTAEGSAPEGKTRIEDLSILQYLRPEEPEDVEVDHGNENDGVERNDGKEGTTITIEVPALREVSQEEVDEFESFMAEETNDEDVVMEETTLTEKSSLVRDVPQEEAIKRDEMEKDDGLHDLFN